jgi:hypothetical protein
MRELFWCGNLKDKPLGSPRHKWENNLTLTSLLLNHIHRFAIPTYCTILYLLFPFLRVSALNLGHPQATTSLFDVYSVFHNYIYISVSLQLNYNVKTLLSINEYNIKAILNKFYKY